MAPCTSPSLSKMPANFVESAFLNISMYTVRVEVQWRWKLSERSGIKRSLKASLLKECKCDGISAKYSVIFHNLYQKGYSVIWFQFGGCCLNHLNGRKQWISRALVVVTASSTVAIFLHMGDAYVHQLLCWRWRLMFYFLGHDLSLHKCIYLFIHSLIRTPP